MIDIEIDGAVFNRKFLPHVYADQRYIVLNGGGGSGKSYFVVQRLIIKLMTADLCNVLAVRRYAKDNRNSTFALFQQIINKWKLGDLFTINRGELRIICNHTKNEVVFAGLDDVEKLKSITFAKGELTDIWTEEASEVPGAIYFSVWS